MTRRDSPGATNKREEDAVERSPFEAALDRAVRLLARRDRSSHEIREALLKDSLDGVDEDVVDAVVSRLESLRHLNDRELALEQASERLHSKGHSPAAIREALAARGIASAIVDDAIDAVVDGESETSLCVAALKRRLGSKSLTLQQAPRYIRTLARLGWSEDAIRQAVESVQPGLSDGLEQQSSTSTLQSARSWSVTGVDSVGSVDSEDTQDAVVDYSDDSDPGAASTLRRRKRPMSRAKVSRTEDSDTGWGSQGVDGRRSDESGEGDPW